MSNFEADETSLREEDAGSERPDEANHREGESDQTEPSPKRTNSPRRKRRLLTPEQIFAVEMKVNGMSDTAIAEGLGVHRSTIHRWKKRPHIKAAINRRTRTLVEELTRRKRAGYDKALDVVLDGIEDGNKALAMQYLKWSDASSLQSPGAYTEDDVLSHILMEEFRPKPIKLTERGRIFAEHLAALEGEEAPEGVDLIECYGTDEVVEDLGGLIDDSFPGQPPT